MISRRVALGTGIDYHVLEWDAPSTHTVLLLHGFLDLAWGWRAVVEAGLRDRVHVLAPDLRGHGDSDWIGKGGYYHFADYLADLEDLVRKCARDTLSIVGHSMGGSVASYFAGTFPERVHRLALLEGIGPPELMPSGPERTATWIAQWRQVRESAPRSFATVEEAAARLQKHDARLTTDLAVELAREGTRLVEGRLRFKHDPLHATIGPYGFQLETAMRMWRNIKCPVLVVDGAESEFRARIPDAGARLACFAQLERVELAGAGHMMQRHQPAALAQLLAKFL